MKQTKKYNYYCHFLKKSKINFINSIKTLINKKPKHKGMASSVRKEGRSRIVELVRPTFKES